MHFGHFGYEFLFNMLVTEISSFCLHKLDMLCDFFYFDARRSSHWLFSAVSLYEVPRQWLGWQFIGGSKYAIDRGLAATGSLNEKFVFSFGENEDFSSLMNSFFDLSQIALIGRSCADYVFNLIWCRRLFKFWIGATKSPGGAKMKIFEKLETFWIVRNVKCKILRIK